MNRIVLTALCIFGTLGIACDTEPTPAASGDAGTVVTNTNTDTATSTATGTGGAVTNGTGGAIGTGGAVSGTGGTSASTCPTCTGSNITITVNITGNGGAMSNGGTAVTGTGGNVASTGGVTGTGGTSAATTTAPPKLCIPGQAIKCAASTGDGRQVCNNDGMSYGPCTALATGGATGTGGATTSTGGTVAGNGVCDAAHVGSVFNGQVCEKDTIDIYVWVPLGSGGATGSGGRTSATGGTVSTGGASATGGSTGAGGDINASMTCDTTMPNGTSVSYAFVVNWAGRPVDNGLPTARFCFSPAHLIVTCDGVMRACPSSATARIYFEAAFGSPSASYDQNLSDMPLTADGYCLFGLVDGNYHVSYSYPGIMTAWACYPALAANPALPLSSKQWIEKDPSGSYGLTFKKVGNTYSLGPYGNNY